MYQENILVVQAAAPKKNSFSIKILQEAGEEELLPQLKKKLLCHPLHLLNQKCQ
jgi:hypothetical protein